MVPNEQSNVLRKGVKFTEQYRDKTSRNFPKVLRESIGPVYQGLCNFLG